MTERVLVIAAHPDDEVLGCGGTMARHAAEGDEVNVLFVADGETSRIMAAKPNRNFAAAAAAKALGAQPPVFLDLYDQKLDIYPLLEITQLIEAHVERIKPTVVYTHQAGDLNLDHCIVHRAVMTALRPLPDQTCRAIHAFEVPSSTEWGCGFAPNHFVDTADYLPQKLKALSCYESEMRPFPHPRSYAAIHARAAILGATSGLRMAEAFMTMRTLR